MTTLRPDVPIATLPGMRWPAVPPAAGSLVLALLHQFAQSERWSVDTLRGCQFAQLNELVGHARLTVPFYRERVDAAVNAGGTLDPERWRDIPLLTRAEVQGAGEAMWSSAVPERHGTLYINSTSGSTGTPVRVRGTQLWQLFWDAITLRDHFWHERDLAGRLVAIRHVRGSGSEVAQALRSPSWGRSPGVAFTTGEGVLIHNRMPVSQQAQVLADENPDYLLAFPSNLQHLIGYCTEHGVHLGRLRGVMTVGEIVEPELRAQCREAWGLPIADIYSTQETGYLALQCPQSDGYHVQSETALVEVLDDGGRPCGPGETGRVVVTPLHNFAQPLIRYDIGDYAEVGEDCPCGRTLPVLNRIVGRKRNMLRLPNGDWVWPAFGRPEFMKLAPIRQQQFVQTAVDTVEVRLVLEHPLTAGQERRLLEHFQSCFRGAVRFVLRPVDSIPRDAGGKFEQFRREIR